MKICIAGQNEIAVRGLELALARLGPERVMVCLNRCDQNVAGWQPSLRRFAAARDVAVVTLAEAAATPDLLFLSLQFDTIIDPARFHSRRLYNIHFSLLPAYKGLYTSAWPLLNGETEAGVTLHEIDHGIDTGDIVAQRSFALPPAWNCRDLFLACMRSGIELLAEQFDRLMDGRPPARPQPPQGASYFSRHSIDYDNLRINLAATAEQVGRQVRAFHFREFQIPVVHDMPVGGVEVSGTRSMRRPGTVVDRDADGMRVATIDYDVDLRRDRSLDFFGFVAGADTDAIRGYAHGFAHIDVTDARGFTPLMSACRAGQVRVCEALLACGANPAFANPNGLTPLLCALAHADSSGDYGVHDLLLAHGVDVERREPFGDAIPF